jgi:hypothetical protein
MHQTLALLASLTLVSACASSPFEVERSEPVTLASRVSGGPFFLGWIDDEPVIGHFDTGSFVVDHSLPGRCGRDFSGVEPDDLWMVGCDVIEHFDGSGWSEVPIESESSLFVSEVAARDGEVFAIALEEGRWEDRLLFRLVDGRFVRDGEHRGELWTTGEGLFLSSGEATYRRREGEWIAIERAPFGSESVSGGSIAAHEGASVSVYRSGAWEVLPDLPLSDTVEIYEEGDRFEQVNELLVVGDEVVALVEIAEYGCVSGGLFGGGGCGRLLQRFALFRYSSAMGWVGVGEVDDDRWDGNQLYAIEGEVWLTGSDWPRMRMGLVPEISGS